MIELKTILLAEDNPQDVELTIEALTEHNLANKVVVVKDGVEAMDYLNYTGQFKNRKKGNPAVLLLDIKMPRMRCQECHHARPPSGCAGSSGTPRSSRPARPSPAQPGTPI